MKTHYYVYIVLLPNFGYFCGALRKKRLYPEVPEMLIYNQNKQFCVFFVYVAALIVHEKPPFTQRHVTWNSGQNM